MQIAQLLVEYGAPVTTEDHEGVSPAALAQTPEQKSFIDYANLKEITMEAYERAQKQRRQLEADTPTPAPSDPSEPNFPQIQKPVRFKKPLM